MPPASSVAIQIKPKTIYIVQISHTLQPAKSHDQSSFLDSFESLTATGVSCLIYEPLPGGKGVLVAKINLSCTRGYLPHPSTPLHHPSDSCLETSLSNLLSRSGAPLNQVTSPVSVITAGSEGAKYTRNKSSSGKPFDSLTIFHTANLAKLHLPLVKTGERGGRKMCLGLKLGRGDAVRIEKEKCRKKNYKRKKKSKSGREGKREGKSGRVI